MQPTARTPRLKADVLSKEMTKDIIVTVAAYAVTVASFLGWIFLRQPERIPRTRKTAFAICLRSLPLFLLFFFVCRSLNVTAVFGFVVLAVIGFFTLTSYSLAGLPGLALFYVLQQWVLGWPDRTFLVNGTTLESNEGKAHSPDPLTGHIGSVLSPLRPSGKVTVDGKELDATCDFGFLDAGAKVIIIGRKNFTFLVQPIE